jgi:hypothetical protein
MVMRALLGFIAILGLVGICGGASASSTTFNFAVVEENNGPNLGDQLSVTVWDAAQANAEYGLNLGANEVLFAFANDVGLASSISEIYFDDGLLGPNAVHNDLGGADTTAFELDADIPQGTTPGNLPGGQTLTPAFESTPGLSADATGNPENGVDASGEIVGISFEYGDLNDYAGVISAIWGESLRIGLHVVGIGDGEISQSYVNAVPIPAAAWLFGSALAGLLALGRRKRSLRQSQHAA